MLRPLVWRCADIRSCWIMTLSGLTAQNYAELAVLYEKYSGRGLEILGFPCNQFGSQEPGTNAEIQVSGVPCTL